jgi:hypothetical protein
MATQMCSKCRGTKELSEFRSGNKKNGKASECKSCTSKASKLNHSKPEVKLRCARQQAARRRSNPSQAMLNNLRNTAKRKGIPFNLTVEDCAIPATCPVLGIPLTFGAEKTNGIISDNSPSMDKIVPLKGYTKGNVCVISWRANHLKNNASLDEIESVARYIRHHS